MSHFEAKAINGEYVALNWQTLSEVNSDYFEIERAVNPNMPAEYLGTVNAFGNSNQPRDYRFEDHDPHMGYAFYRLVEVDIDGQRHYSEWQQVHFEAEGLNSFLEVYPNPSQGIFKLSGTAQSPYLQYKVLNISGQTLFQQQFNLQVGEGIEQKIDLSQAGAGIYLLQIQHGNQQELIKLVVK